MLPDEPRSVKPRHPTPQPWLPIVVVSRNPNLIFSEVTGEYSEWTALPHFFKAHPPAIVTTLNAGWLLAELQDLFHADDAWQYRISPIKRERYNPDPDARKLTTTDIVVNYFGWKGTGRRGHWHYPLDPNVFSAATPVELIGNDSVPLAERLLRWARDIREWCHANNIHLTPTTGGLGGQLLRDPRWYTAPRRKVPRATNANARTVLPGNYYKLFWPENKPVDATYLDMSAAHHNAAADIRFPDANTLYARGNFKHCEPTESTPPPDSPWTVPGQARYARLLASHGLLQIRLNVPAIKADRFPPPYMETMGRRLICIHTNELPLIHALGGEIEGIEAAWVSTDTETGLNGMAAWALTETATMSDRRKRWCKPVLLAAYGNLAAKARPTEWAYRTAIAGTPKDYPAGPRTVPGIANISDLPVEVGTVNVIHRGMIEAETRVRVLNMARHLTETGHTVLSIYADAIIVKAGRALPLLPPPWRIDSHLTRVRFLNSTAFTSAEMTKLPGVAKHDRERATRATRLARLASVRQAE